jgi:hypothetical protein
MDGRKRGRTMAMPNAASMFCSFAALSVWTGGRGLLLNSNSSTSALLSVSKASSSIFPPVSEARSSSKDGRKEVCQGRTGERKGPQGMKEGTQRNEERNQHQGRKQPRKVGYLHLKPRLPLLWEMVWEAVGEENDPPPSPHLVCLRHVAQNEGKGNWPPEMPRHPKPPRFQSTPCVEAQRNQN